MSAVWVDPYPLIPVLQNIGFVLFTCFFVFFFWSGTGLPQFPESSTVFISLLSEERSRVSLLLGKH